MIQFLKGKSNHILQLIIFIIIASISFILNKIPEGSFVAGGDFYQIINPAQNYSRYYYTWFNQVGQGTFNTLIVSYPFYSILALFASLGLGSSSIAGIYVFILLYCSYISFYLFIKILFPSLTNNIRIGGSLIYALNNFTLSILSYPWGFTHHFLLYIFIPPLIFIFTDIFLSKKSPNKSLVLFAVVFMLSTSAYGNLAFLLLLFLTQFLILAISIIFRQVKVDKIFIIKTFKICFIYILSFSWYLIAFYLTTKDNTQKITSSKVFGGSGLQDWIIATSNNFLNVYLLNLDSSKHPAASFDNHSLVVLFAALNYIAVVIFLLLRNKSTLIKENGYNATSNRHNYWLFGLLLIFILLSVRAYGPFKDIMLIIYQLPILNFFRSPDKIMSILPFIYTSSIVGLLSLQGLNKKSIYIILAVLLIMPYLFYTGGIYKALNEEKSGYKYIIQIPKSYYDVQNIINIDDKLGSIISLPYSVVNSLNWSQYPKWHFIGHDILHLLYNKYYISANTYDHALLETTLSFKEFNDNGISSSELLALIQKFSGQFIFIHKDIEPNWIKDSQYIRSMIEELNETHKIELINTNDYFDLYKIKEEYFVPLVVSNSNLIFRRINPTKYKIRLNIGRKAKIVFNQSYNAQWKLFIKGIPADNWCEEMYNYDVSEYVASLFDQSIVINNAKISECKNTPIFAEGNELSYLWQTPSFEKTHEIINKYANSWAIDSAYIKANYSKDYYKVNSDGSIDVDFVLYFMPQSYFYIGLIITFLFLSGSIVYLVHYYWHNKIVKPMN